MVNLNQLLGNQRDDRMVLNYVFETLLVDAYKDTDLSAQTSDKFISRVFTSDHSRWALNLILTCWGFNTLCEQPDWGYHNDNIMGADFMTFHSPVVKA